NGNWAIMQPDGNLVVYSASRKALWDSGTGAYSGSRAVIQNDGNLVLYQGTTARWAQYFDDTLSPGEMLTAGQQLRSPNHNWVVMQADGNLVSYDGANNARWSSQTSGNGNWAIMQPDGNLVVYSASHQALWNSGTLDKPGSRSVIQNDGNFVIYQGGTAVWSSSGPAGETGGPAADQALAWARSQIGATGWDWKCEAFVEAAYGRPGWAGKANPVALFNDQNAKGRIHLDRNPPAGAIVFFAASATNGYNGHAEISEGNGSFISSAPNVMRVNLDWAGTYIGWAYPA
ncbi:MAG: hypothetical protein WCP28_18215, partial [Actinomycetes bacterium]